MRKFWAIMDCNYGVKNTFNSFEEAEEAASLSCYKMGPLTIVESIETIKFPIEATIIKHEKLPF